MNPKHHTSQPISKQLAEAGIVIESEFWWQYTDVPLPDGTRWVVKHKSRLSEVYFELSSPIDIIPAPIATEILERLPASTCLVKKTDLETKEKVRYNAETFTHHPAICPDLHSENPCDALALLLIRLTKDGLI